MDSQVSETSIVRRLKMAGMDQERRRLIICRGRLEEVWRGLIYYCGDRVLKGEAVDKVVIIAEFRRFADDFAKRDTDGRMSGVALMDYYGVLRKCAIYTGDATDSEAVDCRNSLLLEADRCWEAFLGAKREMANDLQQMCASYLFNVGEMLLCLALCDRAPADFGLHVTDFTAMYDTLFGPPQPESKQVA